jgi:hypothetical protein
MQILIDLALLALAAFIGMVLLLSFDTTREWVGLGEVAPTGLPGYIYDLTHGDPPAEAEAA